MIGAAREVLGGTCGADGRDAPAVCKDSTGGLRAVGREDPPAGRFVGGLCSLSRRRDPPEALGGGVRAGSERGHPPERLITASFTSWRREEDTEDAATKRESRSCLLPVRSAAGPCCRREPEASLGLLAAWGTAGRDSAEMEDTGP